MNSLTNSIHFKVINGEEVHEIKTYRAEYRNLMQLLNNSIYLENFGECGGMGRCATCLVKVSGLKGYAGILERNEKANILKAGLSGSNVRLACQILITEELNEATFNISEEGY
ncbi:MAG: 2Fe-2S iron-sulfur cluster binding domain-containing protein [Chitinophagales bacterium]|nr:2Fe-2S iron-sulfur cluster binding domain-containing protein [Chitinophagales bacterium]